MPPELPSLTDQSTAVSGLPLTCAERRRVRFTAIVTAAGRTTTCTAPGRTVTVTVAEREGSAWLVAITWKVPVVGGAV